MSRCAKAAATAGLSAVVLSSCGRRSPSMLDAHGSEAHTVAGVWWLMFGLGAAVYAVVGGFIVWGVVRGRKGATNPEGGPNDTAWVVWGGIAVPVAILALLAVTTVRATADLRQPAGGAVHVEVVAKRWWWAVSYPDAHITAANEIHLPLGRQAEIGLSSDNVIHSFWVPQLAGKMDVIPGQHNVLRFTPEQAGVYRGECAEFCGIEHARMDLEVVVDPPAVFQRWLAQGQGAPLPPDAETVAAGQLDFMRESCAGCHTIAGTQALGTYGPDLTDFGGRLTIAAATLPNTPGNLARWITQAQSLKPGALMPDIALNGQEVQQIVAYLESLR